MQRPIVGMTLWIVNWFAHVNNIIHWLNYYSKLGFCCNLGITFQCTVMRIIRLSISASCTGEQRQHAALIVIWQKSAVIMAVRIESHLCTQHHNMEVKSVCHSDDCSSPVEGSLWNPSPWLVFVACWLLWIPLCSYACKKYNVEKHCVYVWSLRRPTRTPCSPVPSPCRLGWRTASQR